ncbi:putative two-component response regulator-like APRR6 [Raphanus sativus]|uniref:Two-component response regulator-like APRR6 n=1 Tax=Raphanus sativus TaxID=3726 RepID=A0A9W3CR56_RAPSA|nr:putative two-component response regulator-like APRR6 [Raphanus sativus]XP_056857806.1 putative two-component response regulator-like APRR6 [Raphanus sativus]
MSVNGASEAISVIGKQKDIGLVIANVELTDSNYFLTAMHNKEIPLIQINIKEASDLLTKRACFCLKKPISENDIDNMLQHVVPNKRQEWEKINVAEKRENVVEESMRQIQAFRDHIRRQGSSQSSLLGRRPLNKTFTSSEMYRNGRSIENVERRKNVWTRDRHMKFLAAISILGEKESRPKPILEIMNDSNLSQRQVASHLQKYKFQVERISNTLTRNEWKSTDKTFHYPSDYVYPFKASNLMKNIIESNSMWYSLRRKKCSSSSTVQYSFERSAAERKGKMPKFHLEETSGLHSHSLFGSSVGASSLDAFQKESAQICINPNPSQPSSYVLETNRNPLDMNQMGTVSLGENHGFSQDTILTKSNHLGLVSGETSHIETPPETDINQMDWDWIFAEADYAILEDMTVSETNRTQVGLGPSETSFAALDNVAPPANNTNEIELVPYEEGNDIPIEDLVSFDTDMSEMDLDAWLENYDSFQRDVPLLASCINHDLAFTPATSQHQNIEAANPREAIEGVNHLDDDSDQNLDWIDDIFA